MILGNSTYLLLLLLFPLMGLIIIRYIRWKKSRKHIFAESSFHKNIFGGEHRFSRIIPYFYLLSLLFLIFSIIDLVAGEEKVESKQKVSNIIFVLDVSNSMNTEDVPPSRLEMAKDIISSTLPSLSGSRIGLVVFAGEAASIMPLTSDLSATENYINGIQSSIIKVQGTDFLKAIETAAAKFHDIPKGSRHIILLSDGEDNEGNEDSAISLAQKEGISVTTVGIGTPEGAPIPEYFYGQLMGYKSDLYGETIISKRQEKALKNIAKKTNASYIDGNNRATASSEIISNIKNRAGNSSIIIESQNTEHYYQYFLAVSIFFLFIIYLFNPKRNLNL